VPPGWTFTAGLPTYRRNLLLSHRVPSGLVALHEGGHARAQHQRVAVDGKEDVGRWLELSYRLTGQFYQVEAMLPGNDPQKLRCMK